MRTEASPVLAGQKVKWTLEQIEQSNPGRVRLDWLRFTVPLDAVIQREPGMVELTAIDLMDKRTRDLVRMANGVDEVFYTSAHKVAEAGARQVADLLGCGIQVGSTLARGMDFYSARAELVFEGAVVGQVLAGGQKHDQAATVHVNLHGAAMLLIDASA